jgi:RNA polymerase sigma-70 factor (ECF subfamily)
MHVPKLGLVIVGLLATALAATGQEAFTLASAPPVVVKTVPEAGDDNVDPGLGEIRITFSKKMQPGNFSVVQNTKENFPDVAGKPRYDTDQRTLLLPVKLQAGRTYALWVNTERFRNCKDENGQPALPYLLVFRTRGGGAEPPAPRFDPAVGLAAFDALWADMDRRYSYFEHKHIDWPGLKAKYRPQFEAAATRREYLKTLSALLAELKDGHVWIEVPWGSIYPHRFPPRPTDVNPTAILRTLAAPRDLGGYVTVGTTRDDRFAAIVVTQQNRATRELNRQLLDFIAEQRQAPGFIVDLRRAGGGNEALAREIAERFCAKEVVYARSLFRGGPGHTEFTRPLERKLKAAADPIAAPLVVVLGPGCVSSGEGWAKMFAALPQVKTIGQPTLGSSGNPQPFTLPGLDIKVWYSRWVDQMPDGTVVEDHGIHPQIPVSFGPEAFASADPTWEKALAVLKSATSR